MTEDDLISMLCKTRLLMEQLRLSQVNILKKYYKPYSIFPFHHPFIKHKYMKLSLLSETQILLNVIYWSTSLL